MKFISQFCVAFIMVTMLVVGLHNHVNAAPLAEFIVNNLGDDGDALAGDAQCATAGGVCTLRAAIEEANQHAGDDVINFDVPPDSAIAAFSDELLITDTVTINGLGKDRLQVNTGFNFHRVVRVAAGDDAVVRITNLTIVGGILPVGNGAGILLESGILVLDKVVIQSCYAQNGRGGGIAVEGGTLSFHKSELGNNVADEEGGGLYNSEFGTVVLNSAEIYHNDALRGAGVANRGQMTVNESNFSKNIAEIEGGAIAHLDGSLEVKESWLEANAATYGGGLYNDGDTIEVSTTQLEENSASLGGGAITNLRAMTIVESLLVSNYGGIGGAIYNTGNLTLRQSEVQENSVPAYGGGIYNTEPGVLVIDQSTISGNQTNGAIAPAKVGGGILNHLGDITISNSTISGNAAGEMGGGVFNSGGIVRIQQSTIVLNTAPVAGGMMVGAEAVTEISNSIVAQNGGGDCVLGVTNPNGLVAYHTNLDSDGTCPNFSLANYDPMLQALAQNGTRVSTHMPEENSPALNAGLLEGCLVVENRDQRNFVRMAEGENSCDLGAVERDGVYVPTPVEPAEPVEPSEPVEPIEPTEPGGPEEPGEPIVAGMSVYLPMVERVE